eukprot:TRINITY_DN14442_c0_g2_i1.p1 TRINITY_DN14442_c0_g2~~TRINITY_DN14442_c0_g2_i1.p1  ORF type:complete len:335 (-),score=65.23 TRINITY_DN14442_c0_g2_i1:41-1045(-)
MGKRGGRKAGGPRGKKQRRGGKEAASEKIVGTKRAPPPSVLPDRAVFVTCMIPSKCGRATSEAIGLLKTARNLLRPDAADDKTAEDSATANAGTSAPSQASSAATPSVNDLLAAELKELQTERETEFSTRERICFHCEPCRGVAIICCPQKSQADSTFPMPSALVNNIFERYAKDSNGELSAVRFLARLVPLDFVCSPHPKNFAAAAVASLPGAFSRIGAKEGSTWYCSFNCRAMSTIKREDVLVACKDVLRPLGYDMEVSEADYIVVVEVNPALCGFSVLKAADYENSMQQCNLQKVCSISQLPAAADTESEDEDDDGDSADENPVGDGEAAS